MPSPYSSRGSVDDALALARNLGIKCLQIPIANALAAFKAEFTEIFAGLPEDTTEENIQPRLRAMTLMPESRVVPLGLKMLPDTLAVVAK